MKSIEEKIEDIAKAQLKDCKTYTKTESINPEIDEALKKAPSKNGGKGNNYPDIKLFLTTKTNRKIPVMIEVKGKQGYLIKTTETGEIDNSKSSNIQKYAVNGALHYADAIIKHTQSYKEVIAIGFNGYEDAGGIKTELGVYYVSADNFCIPKKVDDYSDLSFLNQNNFENFIKKVDVLSLTDEEKESRAKDFENQIEIKLKALNQKMHDELKISVGSRVQLVAGLIMAALGVENRVSPLEITDLKGETGNYSNDGKLVINKIADFLSEKNLPKEKKDLIVSDLSQVFIYSRIYMPINGESAIKTVYTVIKNDIMPIFTSARHLDFTGRLFNVLNEWVDIPDGEKNDVVLTPRYVCELMAKLCQVNKDSYVWDYATGSAGFLISAMKQMIGDAEKSINSPQKLQEKIACIKYFQLLGVEVRADIYMLAVLNMILMGDGSCNILHKDSLKDFNGKYEQGTKKDEPFPADVFLLNPPYSADGKGFVFVEKALGKMTHGRAAILIQENAGSGNGLPYTKEILKNNSLIASIHMSDIFCGKAGVQTAIYVFDVGKPHNVDGLVTFIDFSNDGYTRQNKKKASADVNLKDTGNARGRYREIVDIVLNRKQTTHYFDNCVIKDTITLNGNDWTYAQHKKIDTIPTEADFRKTVADYLSWKVSTILKEEGLFESFLKTTTSEKLSNNKDAHSDFKKESPLFKEFKIGDLFNIHPTKAYKLTNFYLFKEYGKTPVISNSSLNNGVIGYSSLSPTEKGNIITYSDTTTSDGIFYQPTDFIGYPHVQGLYPLHSDKWSEKSLLYFVSLFKKSAAGRFDYANKFNRKTAAKLTVHLPVTASNEIDFSFMESFITAQQKLVLKNLLLWLKEQKV